LGWVGKLPLLFLLLLLLPTALGVVLVLLQAAPIAVRLSTYNNLSCINLCYNRRVEIQ